MSFRKNLDKFCKYALSERDKGDKFGKLTQAYLQTDLKYATLFSTVWLWNDFYFCKNFGGKILGLIWLLKLTMETIGQFSVNALPKITF